MRAGKGSFHLAQLLGRCFSFPTALGGAKLRHVEKGKGGPRTRTDGRRTSCVVEGSQYLKWMKAVTRRESNGFKKLQENQIYHQTWGHALPTTF